MIFRIGGENFDDGQVIEGIIGCRATPLTKEGTSGPALGPPCVPTHEKFSLIKYDTKTSCGKATLGDSKANQPRLTRCPTDSEFGLEDKHTPRAEEVISLIGVTSARVREGLDPR